MGSAGQRILESMLYRKGERRLKICFIKLTAEFQPWRVWYVEHNNGKYVSSGMVVSAPSIEEGQDLYAKTCREAEAKGWAVQTYRLGYRANRVTRFVPIPD